MICALGFVYCSGFGVQQSYEACVFVYLVIRLVDAVYLRCHVLFAFCCLRQPQMQIRWHFDQHFLVVTAETRRPHMLLPHRLPPERSQFSIIQLIVGRLVSEYLNGGFVKVRYSKFVMDSMQTIDSERFNWIFGG